MTDERLLRGCTRAQIERAAAAQRDIYQLHFSDFRRRGR